MADMKLTDDELLRIKMEVKMREKYLEQEMTPIVQENLERYTGHFIPGMAQDWDVMLNEFYPVIQYNLPSIFFRNPRVFLKPRQKTFIAKKRNPLSGAMEETELDSSKSAKTQEAILNYIMEEIKYKKEVRRVLFDSLVMPYGVLWHGYKGEFGMTEEQSMYIKKESLFVKRISPLRFIYDPAVTIANIEEGRWVGRSFDIPLQDLVDDDTLDVDPKQIQGKVGFGQKVGTKDAMASMEQATNGSNYVNVFQSGSRALIEYTSDAYRKSKSVRFVTVYEIFQRPSKKEARNGERGKVILLTDEQTKPLRVNKWPYKFDGWPADILQFNEVQDSNLGLDDFKTYSGEADQKNIIINELIRNAKQLNKNWTVLAKEGMSAEEDQAKIRDGRNTVILYDGDSVQGKMLNASASGNGSQQELANVAGLIDQSLQQKSGVSDQKMGSPPKSGEESAFNAKMRAQGGGARPAYRQDLMADFLRNSCLKLNHLNKQFMTIDEAVRIIGSNDLQWSEKPTREEIQADVDVELDVYSMLPENPDDEMKQLNTALNMGIESLTNPAVGQKLAQEGYTFEMAPLVEQILRRMRIFDPNVFRRIKPEESQGFAPVAELRAAKDNVNAALAGSPQIPSPPALGQNHDARLEIYTEIMQILQEGIQQGVIPPDAHASIILQQLIQMQQAVQQEEQKQKPNVGQKVPPSQKGAFKGHAVMGAK